MVVVGTVDIVKKQDIDDIQNYRKKQLEVELEGLSGLTLEYLHVQNVKQKSE